MESPVFEVGAEVVVQDRRGWKGIQYSGPFKVTEIKKRPKVICINSKRYPEWSWNGHHRDATAQVILVVSTPELIEAIRLQNTWHALINFCDDMVRIGNGPIGSIEDIAAALEALKKVAPKAEK